MRAKGQNLIAYQGQDTQKMQIDKKYWTDMLDADSADFRVQQNAYTNMQDFRFGPTSDKGFSEQLEAVGGTSLINNSALPSGQNYCIGRADDLPNRREVFFNWNSLGNHGIYCFDYVNNRIDPVLLNADTEGLNFDKDSLIHSARVENGSVYWTDNLNHPRRLNIQSGIEMYLVPGNIPPGYVLNTQSLYVSNIDPLNGAFKDSSFLVFTFSLPEAPIPSYRSKLINYILRWTGADGSVTTSTTIFINWNTYPTDQANALFLEAVVTLLGTLGTPHTDWDVYGQPSSNTSTFYIKNTWDFGTGNPFFAPIAKLELIVNNYVYSDGSIPKPYVSTLSEAVISWARRQPGVPPNASKLTQTSPVLSSNLIAADAFQFAYRYVYKDGEISTMSAFTFLQNFNADADLFNRIDVAISTIEKIDQDIIEVDLIARYMVSNISFVIHSWRTVVPADQIAINLHNGNVASLFFSFYNDVAGIALDTAYSNKNFDSIPILCETIEMAKQRGFMGNYLIGYDAPPSTSLALSTTSITLNTGTSTTVNGEWNLLKWEDAFFVAHSAYVIVTTMRVFGNEPLGPVYVYTYSSTVPPFPSFINSATITFQGNSALNAAVKLQGGPVSSFSITDQGAGVVINVATVTGTGSVVARVFKSYASYQLGVHFLDRYGAPCGEVTSPGLTVSTGDVFSGGTSAYTYVNAITWTLSNANSIGEIPAMAWYYSIDITLCLRTRFFVQGLGLVIYASRDTSNNYTFTTTAYSSTLAGVAIDITGLQSYAQGYVFSQGDTVRLYVNNAYYNLSIIGQSAQYIICQLQDVGSLVTTSGHYEIFTPYQRQTNEPFYEISQIYPIFNAGLATRVYSILSGNISGDTYVFNRGGYLTEGMNPTDKHYTSWFTDAGRPNFVDYIGQVRHKTSVAFSNTFIAGSQNNGLSTFDALDTQDLSPDFGPIEKLQLASKISKIGTVMLAICSGPTTASIYLGENTLISQTGDSVVAQSNTVIGSVHELKGGFGTLNPESVIEFRGSIYWFDVQNGMVIQYADNGLFPISNYKTSRFWKLFADTYKATSTSTIEGFGYRPFVFGAVDPHHGEVLFSIPKVLVNAPNGTLPDYPSINYPFDIWDGQGKTMVYKLYTDPNHWQGSYSFSPDYMFYLEDNLFSFKNGNIYLHNQPNYCNYYGQQANPTVMGVGNQQVTKPKVWQNFFAEANETPSFIYLMSLYPYTQSSDLLTYDFENKEGVWYAPIYRNKLDPAFNNFSQALIAGEKMRTTAIYYMAQWAGGSLVQVKFVNLGYTVSLGQKT